MLLAEEMTSKDLLFQNKIESMFKIRNGINCCSKINIDPRQHSKKTEGTLEHTLCVFFLLFILTLQSVSF